MMELENYIASLKNIKEVIEANHETIEKQKTRMQDHRSESYLEDPSDIKHTNLYSYLEYLDKWEATREQKRAMELVQYKHALDDSSKFITDPAFYSLQLRWCKEIEKHLKFIIENRSLLEHNLERIDLNGGVCIPLFLQKFFKEWLEKSATAIKKSTDIVNRLLENPKYHVIQANNLFLALSTYFKAMKKIVNDIKSFMKQSTAEDLK